jgi:murein DD-endopeptidase MepM/ murein hydrolase activator NlpD
VLSFPGPARRRATVALALGALLLGGAAAPRTEAAHADDLTGKKHEVERTLRATHDDLDSSTRQLRGSTRRLLRARAELSAARAELVRTRGELAAARALDAQMQSRLEAARARLARARTELAEGRRRVAEQGRTLSGIVVDGYQTAAPGLLGLEAVLTSDDPAQLTGQLSSMRTVTDKQQAVLDRLRAARVVLAVQEEETEAAEAEVAAARAAAAENLRARQALEAQAAAEAGRVAGLVRARGEARRAAVAARNADLARLRRLERERDRIARLIRERASRGTGASPASGGGYLDYPVTGWVTSAYGWRTHPIWGYRSLHDGIDLGAGCGTPIRASADGRVISEYYQSAWGNRLIVDHGVRKGVGLATISNHLSGYAVGVGARVRRGQVVGYVGTTGWSTGCHLHFTVLENGVAVDPMKWL